MQVREDIKRTSPEVFIKYGVSVIFSSNEQLEKTLLIKFSALHTRGRSTFIARDEISLYIHKKNVCDKNL